MKAKNESYKHREDVHNFSAAEEVVPLVMELVNPTSILDVGCGIGTWLKIFENKGINDYFGTDGDYVDRKLLKIPLNKYLPADLTKELNLNRKFDLVVSLEVAEHLPETSADAFVKTLTKHGDTILFSAAIPGQRGQHHLNEQWPSYWQQKFLKHGYYFHDVIRKSIWNNEKVDWWYRQNIFLLTKEIPSQEILNIVHPECFNQQLQHYKGINESIVTGRIGVSESFKIFLRSLKIKTLS